MARSLPVGRASFPGVLLVLLVLVVFVVLVLPASSAALAADDLVLDRASAGRFAAIALGCAEREFPNKPDHVLNDAADARPPAALHPAFYGCFDWHSAVHGHWLLVRLLRLDPGLPEAPRVRALLDRHLAEGPIAAEVAYLGAPNRKSFERTYGWAWLLKLDAELRAWDDPDARRWAAALRPLSDALKTKLVEFLPKQTYPIRTGVHPNTAYALALALDHAAAAGDGSLEALLRERARAWFGADRDAPIAWEPGGEDFLSPALEEAALMVRVLPAAERRRWLKRFLPGLLRGGDLVPAVVSDRTDPKIVHLDGLNLSRARCLYALAAVLGPGDRAAAHLRRLGDAHARASLPHIASGSYEGEHWLATFALHMLDARAALETGGLSPGSVGVGLRPTRAGQSPAPTGAVVDVPAETAR